MGNWVRGLNGRSAQQTAMAFVTVPASVKTRHMEDSVREAVRKENSVVMKSKTAQVKKLILVLICLFFKF